MLRGEGLLMPGPVISFGGNISVLTMSVVLLCGCGREPGSSGLLEVGYRAGQADGAVSRTLFHSSLIADGLLKNVDMVSETMAADFVLFSSFYHEVLPEVFAEDPLVKDDQLLQIDPLVRTRLRLIWKQSQLGTLVTDNELKVIEGWLGIKNKQSVNQLDRQ